MTEPNEPKIVHFPPRAQAPVQDTAGNWEPNEQLFGLEELLQQLPPIRKLHLEKGRLTDLVRLYPDMKRTFDAPERLPEAVIASAMVRRRMELLLFRADDRREAGYALVTVCSPYGYVLVHALTIYPYLRGQLLGRVAMELIARCYAGKKGILYCQSRTCVALPERERLLTKNGYRDTGFRFRWGGQPAALYLRPCQSTEDITPVAQLLLRDLYGDLLPPVNARRMIQPEASTGGQYGTKCRSPRAHGGGIRAVPAAQYRALRAGAALRPRHGHRGARAHRGAERARRDAAAGRGNAAQLPARGRVRR